MYLNISLSLSPSNVVKQTASFFCEREREGERVDCVIETASNSGLFGSFNHQENTRKEWHSTHLQFIYTLTFDIDARINITHFSRLYQKFTFYRVFFSSLTFATAFFFFIFISSRRANIRKTFVTHFVCMYSVANHRKNNSN